MTNALLKDEPFEGALWAARHGLVSGWAWDRRDPEQAVEVELFAGGVRLGRAIASAFDPSQPSWVREQHNFQLPVSPALLVPHYTIRARVDGSACELDRAIDVASPHAHADAMVGYASAVIGIKGGAIEGWAVSKSNSSLRVMLEMHYQSEVLATVVADRPKPTMPEFEAGHGFRLPIPLLLLDDAVHKISLKFAANQLEVDVSPISVALLAADKILDRLEAC